MTTALSASAKKIMPAIASLISHSRERHAILSSFLVIALSTGTGSRRMREGRGALEGSATVWRRIFERLITRECVRAGTYRPVTAARRAFARQSCYLRPARSLASKGARQWASRTFCSAAAAFQRHSGSIEPIRCRSTIWWMKIRSRQEMSPIGRSPIRRHHMNILFRTIPRSTTRRRLTANDGADPGRVLDGRPPCAHRDRDRAARRRRLVPDAVFAEGPGARRRPPDRAEPAGETGRALGSLPRRQIGRRQG